MLIIIILLQCGHEAYKREFRDVLIIVVLRLRNIGICLDPGIYLNLSSFLFFFLQMRLHLTGDETDHVGWST